jgi:hypothetical protein
MLRRNMELSTTVVKRGKTVQFANTLRGCTRASSLGLIGTTSAMRFHPVRSVRSAGGLQHSRAMMTKRALPLVAALMMLAPNANATEAGLDVGHVVDGAVVHDNTAVVDSTGVGWVRINMRLDDWTSPDDDTRRGPDQLTWFEAYDRVVDAYLARGIDVYALINDEAVSSSLDHETDPWIELYVQNAVKIVDHFKNRIRIYEVINEPNDYAGGESARFTPRAFAKILQDTYLAVKHDAGHIDDRCWQVQLVSGPMFSFDGVPSADYLQQTYAIGRAQLAWDYTHQATGSFPLDGIGYHIYVAQGTDSPTSEARTATEANLDAVWSVVAAHEGADTAKRLWISEYGWRADWVGETGQSERMRAGFDAMNESGKVAAAMYFNLQDFPGAAYGIYDDGGQRRISADMLKSIAEGNRPADGARVVNVVVPVLAPGATGEAIVTVENRGAERWTGDVRIGAAAGCPDATTANDVEWIPGDGVGYANGLGDARIFVPADVGAGESVEFHVPVRAPAQEGQYTFAARMVHEGVGWFGPTAIGTLVVAANANGSDAVQPSTGGCSTSGAPASSLVVIVALLLRRRRR